jgi:hypothetical protein
VGHPQQQGSARTTHVQIKGDEFNTFAAHGLVQTIAWRHDTAQVASGWQAIMHAPCDTDGHAVI